MKILMLGLSDPVVALAYWGNILAVVFCVLFGIVNWNKGDDPFPPKKGRKRDAVKKFFSRKRRSGGSEAVR